MKLENYDIESLRNLVRKLEKENISLKNRLKKEHISFEENLNIFDDDINQSEYEVDQGDLIESPSYISENHAKLFFSIFWGRSDVFAKRSKNGNYYPQCDNRWNKQLCKKYVDNKFSCFECPNRKWTKLELKKIIQHLNGFNDDGSDVIGVYPLLEDGTCRFIVFDFDNHNDEIDSFNDINKLRKEVDALRIICEYNKIKCLVERSRSGKGAHLWIFFKSPISAYDARRFAFLLLEKGATQVNFNSFKYYDRLYPSQDISDSIGNLIALPLQGRALLLGNSAFVDKKWNAYPNQWQLLNNSLKIEKETIYSLMEKWTIELNEYENILNLQVEENRVKPWKKNIRLSSSDVDGQLHIVLSNGIYIDCLNIKPRLQNQLRSLAAFDNPDYYKNKRLGYSNYKNFSSLYYGSDENGYIHLPRGLKEKIIEKCIDSNIKYELIDERCIGKPIRVSFNGDLRVKQQLAASKLLEYTDGILSAATAFGKTVVCSYIISQRKINTLILVQSKDLLHQWFDELNKFLIINEPLPIYKTKKGKEKTRNSTIGLLYSGKNTLGGIIDIAMVGSINGIIEEDIVNKYGMVIMDECHHAAANTSIKILQKVKAKYVYGVSATVRRTDKLDKLIIFMLGPIRHTYSALERSKEQNIKQLIIPRYTRCVDNYESKENINKAYELIKNHESRNEIIIEDTTELIGKGMSPIILTKFKEHALYFYNKLKLKADKVFLIYGDNTEKDNIEIRNKLKLVSKEESLIIIATGQKIGEGFDFPRLDALLLVSPISSSGKLEQFVGRVCRNYPGKEAVYVYDYVDAHMNFFSKMYNKRLTTYKKIGFAKEQPETIDKSQFNSIFDYANYFEKFRQDLVEANREIIISSPSITINKIENVIEIIKQKIENNVHITIITTTLDGISINNSEVTHELITILINNGINVQLKDEINKHFAVIDGTIVWHGGVNILGKEDIHDNIIRIVDSKVAEELLFISD